MKKIHDQEFIDFIIRDYASKPKVTVMETNQSSGNVVIVLNLNLADLIQSQTKLKPSSDEYTIISNKSKEMT